MQLAFRLRSVNDFACAVKGKVHCLSQPLTACKNNNQISDRTVKAVSFALAERLK